MALSRAAVRLRGSGTISRGNTVKRNVCNHSVIIKSEESERRQKSEVCVQEVAESSVQERSVSKKCVKSKAYRVQTTVCLIN